MAQVEFKLSRFLPFILSPASVCDPSWTFVETVFDQWQWQFKNGTNETSVSCNVTAASRGPSHSYLVNKTEPV